MSQKCPPSYRNLNTIQSYSEQKYATVQWCQQNCENDEWLKREVEKLKYLTPPNVRKKFNIGIDIKEDKSWGYDIKSENSVQFSSKDSETIFLNFKDNEGEEWIDRSKTTVVMKPYTVLDGEGNQIPKSKIVLPNHTDPINVYFGTGVDNQGYNSAWYVGFDKSKNFYLKPSWIKDWRLADIPSIARAQTFKVPTGKGGKLESVDLQLEYNGGPTTSSSPLYVQIWTTYQASAYVSSWDNKKKEVVYKYVKADSSTPSSYQRYKKVTTYKKKKVKQKNGKYKWEYVKDKKGKKIVVKEEYKKDKKGTYVRKRTKIAKPLNNLGKVDGEVKEQIRVPLAEYVYNPQSTNKGGWQTMSFDNPPVLEAGKSYAIVLFSPLNSWDNCPRWAGWGRNCKRDKLYPDGDACISYNNGRTWYRYGQNDKKNVTEYKQGKYTPQDYRFSCTINQGETTIYEEGDHYLYLKPIYSNPIYRVEIAPDGIGTETYVQDKVQCDYQLSVDGESWISFPDGLWTLELDEPTNVVFIRVKMSRTSGDAYKTETPSLESLKIKLYTNVPNEMYVRTTPYTPPLGHILGASLWGKVYAPYTTEPSVECAVDIIEEREAEESFSIIELELLDEKMIELGLDTKWMESLAPDNNRNALDARAEYLSNYPEILDELKYHRVYVKPYESENDGVMYNLSFAPSTDDLIVTAQDTTEAIDEDTEEELVVDIYPDDIGGIKITDEVAYPIIRCELEPDSTGHSSENSDEAGGEGNGHGGVQTFGEWYSYVFDYTNNEIIFRREVLEKMVSGNLTVYYNPVFIKDLTTDEVGKHYDENGIESDGLVLDYFKESFVINADNVETRRVQLRVQPVDTVRFVYLYKKEDMDEGKEPIELHEDVDYTVDIYSKELVFEVNNVDGVSTILSLGDTLEVIYTPNLKSDSISLGYHAKRTNLSMQCDIGNYYIEYKV